MEAAAREAMPAEAASMEPAAVEPAAVKATSVEAASVEATAAEAAVPATTAAMASRQGRRAREQKGCAEGRSQARLGSHFHRNLRPFILEAPGRRWSLSSLDMGTE